MKPMSLQLNLACSVLAVLLVSLIAGAAMTYEHAVNKVRTEMLAALAVGRGIVSNAVDDDVARLNPAHLLMRVIEDFNGDRHLRAILIDARGKTLIESAVQPPTDPAPRFFFDLVRGKNKVEPVDLPPAFGSGQRLVLEADPHNEVAEAWGDVKLDFSTLAMFFCLVLGLITYTLRGAFRPLQDLCRALSRIAAGDYGARLSWPNAYELNEVERGFNAMARRLAEMELQNRLLQARVDCAQEDERGQMARDLHDEVAPFLFAVSADASLIRQFAAKDGLRQIEERAASIVGSVSHMQQHVRGLLARLMPDVLVDLGLSGALESLVDFWQSHRPEIDFNLSIASGPFDSRCCSVIFRVVQESLSNAVRHANPSKVDVFVKRSGESCEIEVRDDGSGLKQASNTSGFGLLGMRDRVAAIGGDLSVANRRESSGVVVHAIFKCRGDGLVAE
jgi:two-component system sensor histidine kinase UhpB